MRRRLAVIAMLVLLIGCGSQPTAPTPAAPAAAPAVTVQPPRSFPPLVGPFRTYTFAAPLSYAVREFTKLSRFVLYDNGAFVLRYDASGNGYEGAYTEADGVIKFDWVGWSSAGPWGATGTLDDGVLTVRYNLVMELSDFENGVYRLAAVAGPLT